MNENIINELFGKEELSDDYLVLLKSYQITEEDGISIRDETVEFVSSLNRYWNYEDYEMMLFTIDTFREHFSRRFKEIHNREINLDTLDQYKPNKLYWQITDDREKTKQLLALYTGEDFLNDIFLKDLVKYNLLGQYNNMRGILFNTPSKEFIGQDVRQCCLLKFEELNLLDKIEEKHPQSMKDAVRYLICNLNQEEIDEIYESGMNKYAVRNHFLLGMWIRNEFGLNEKINSKLIYDCYVSKYNDDNIGKMGPLWMADAASPVILKELWAEVHKNYDEIKKHKLTGEIDKEKYVLVDFIHED
ncbi:MAG: hypothetical protein IKF11_01170 [Methanobrevibacter sp.]|nr:hypothetical protein [Methanobrevibacter sp.]